MDEKLAAIVTAAAVAGAAAAAYILKAAREFFWEKERRRQESDQIRRFDERLAQTLAALRTNIEATRTGVITINFQEPAPAGEPTCYTEDERAALNMVSEGGPAWGDE